jgi:tetratricopeptide (TPR) repeat protein
MSASLDDGYVHNVKGQVLRAQRRCAEAIPEYEAALAFNPNSASNPSALGRCKMRLGLMAEAIPLYEQAIRLSPRDSNISLFHNRIGEAQLLQRIDSATAELAEARRLKGDDSYSSIDDLRVCGYMAARSSAPCSRLPI